VSTKRASDFWKSLLAHLRFGYSRYLDRRFDRRYGVETMQELLPQELYPADQIPESAHRYQPTSSLDFEEMMRAVDVRHEDFAFLDLGAGKGKALMLASRYGFERIIGVELSRRLHDIAEANLAKFRGKTGAENAFELRCQDADQIEWPETNLFIYVFNPFGRAKLEKVFEGLARSQAERPRRLVVLCRRSGAVDVLEHQEFLQEVLRTPVFRVYVDVMSS
jgi:SAM-dependent methyltransferase